MDHPELLNALAMAMLLAVALLAGVIVYMHSAMAGLGSVEATLRGLEISATMLLGGLVARTFVWLLLALANFSPAATFVVGWVALFWPGIFDTLAWLFTGHTIFQASDLVGLATIVGTLAAAFDGWAQIHAWSRAGTLTFLADHSWGLANTTNGCLIHLANLGWGGRIESKGRGAHRYRDGVCFGRRFALTQGNVCSNLREHADSDLFNHEYIHVCQNRYFGPVFPLTYVGWMIALFIPAAAWGIYRRNLGRTIFSWCYLNSPWEEWAYQHGGYRDPDLVWPARTIVFAAWSFITVVFFLSLYIIIRVWFGDR